MKMLGRGAIALLALGETWQPARALRSERCVLVFLVQCLNAGLTRVCLYRFGIGCAGVDAGKA